MIVAAVSDPRVDELAAGRADAAQVYDAAAAERVSTTGELKANEEVELRSEAQLQGIDASSVVWQCTAACYDRSYLDAGDVGNAVGAGAHIADVAPDGVEQDLEQLSVAPDERLCHSLRRAGSACGVD